MESNLLMALLFASWNIAGPEYITTAIEYILED